MEKEQKKLYTLNFISNGKHIPYAKGSILAIDFVTTNYSYKDKDDLIQLLQDYSGVDFKIDDIAITHVFDEEERKVFMLFSEQGEIIDKRNEIPNRIIRHLSSYDNVTRLLSQEILNKYIKFRLTSLHDCETQKKADFMLEKLRIELMNDYKLMRDFAVTLHFKLLERGKGFLTPERYKIDLEAIYMELNELEIVDEFKKVYPKVYPGIKDVVRSNNVEPTIDNPYEQVTINDFSFEENDIDEDYGGKKR